jgi:hypothetical protein
MHNNAPETRIMRMDLIFQSLLQYLELGHISLSVPD